MSIKCNAYHGTDAYSQKRIIENQSFIESSRDNEWAGTGVYFFIDSDENTARQHAYDWAKNFKNIPTNEIGILLAEIEYNKDEMFDLTNEQGLKVFNTYRRVCFEKAQKAAETKNKTLSTTYKNSSKFDCYIINEICKKAKFKIVKKFAYISKLEETYNGIGIPNSYVPNCTIAAVRDQNIIERIKVS